MPPSQQRNFQHLVLEVTWFGLALASTSRFLSVFAIRLGATPVQLGWLTALPFAVLLLSTTLSTRWRRHFSNSIQAIYLPSLGFRFVFLFPALTPLFPSQWQTPWLIFSAALAALPQGISNTIFVSMMREAVPQDKLTPLMSRRNIGMNITLGIAALGFGVWLENAPYPLNYQVMFLFAFLMALASHLQLMRVRVQPVKFSLPDRQNSVRPLQSPKFRITLLVAVLIYLSFFAIVPVTPLHLVESLGANEGFMALFGLAEISAAAVVSAFTNRLVQRIGNQRMIAFAMVGTCLAAIVLASAQDLRATLLAASISGASWTAATIGLFGLLYESTHDVADADMTRFITLYNQVMFCAAFIGPMIGSNLANLGIPLVTVMLAGASLRLLAGGIVYALDHHLPRLVSRLYPNH